MVSPEAQIKLNELVLNNGRNAIHDAKTFEGLLRDTLADYPRDANLLASSLHAGIPQAIAAGSTDGLSLAEKLQDEGYVALDAASAAVRAWATALEKTVVFVAPPEEPALPIVEVIVPAKAPIARPEPVYTAPPQRWSPRMFLYPGIIAGVLILGGALAYFIWGRSAEPPKLVAKPRTTTTIVDTTKPPKPDDSPFSPSLTGGSVEPDPNTPKPTPPVSGDTAGSDSADFDAYNAKLASWHTRMIAALQNFQSKADAASSAADQNAALDQVGEACSNLADAMDGLASELDGLKPPLEAATIHKKLMANAHAVVPELRTMATNAKAHDQQLFQDSQRTMAQAGEARKNEIDSSIIDAGYDPDTFQATGTLVRK